MPTDRSKSPPFPLLELPDDLINTVGEFVGEHAGSMPFTCRATRAATEPQYINKFRWCPDYGAQPEFW
jgi:hypothetical protein